MLENPMVLERPEPIAVNQGWPECDCGSRAYLEVNGNLRCFDCAEDEGVKRI